MRGGDGARSANRRPRSATAERRPGGAEAARAGTPGMKSGFVAVLGRPNVGKSTLVNRLVGRKVSIVSDRPQTTRRRIAGVVTRPGCQAVLLDLPGFQRPFDELTRRMQRTVDQSLEEVDAALIMLNAAETLGGGDRYIVAAAAASGTPAVVALNKCDAIAAESLIRAQAEAQALAGDLPVLAVSALRGDNVEQLLDVVIETLPTGPQYFPDESVSDQPLEILIAELVREQVLRRTRDEVPHAVAVRVEEIVERKDRPLVEIEATVVVETESQKAIVIGKGGALIKQIGSAARHEIEAVVGARVFLSLRVKVRRKWRRDSSSVERFV